MSSPRGSYPRGIFIQEFHPDGQYKRGVDKTPQSTPDWIWKDTWYCSPDGPVRLIFAYVRYGFDLCFLEIILSSLIASFPVQILTHLNNNNFVSKNFERTIFIA